MDIKCPHCNQKYDADESYIGTDVSCQCGKTFRVERQPLQKKRCPMCGEEIFAIAKKCRFCGEYIDPEARIAATPVEQKSRIIYILLGFFLGGIGAHNFYAGENSSGRIKIYLLFLPVIGWLASLIITIWEICTVDKDSEGNPLI